MFTKTLASLTLWAAAAGTESAADWQNCLAPSHAEHKIYLSAPFAWSGAWGDQLQARKWKLNRPI